MTNSAKATLPEELLSFWFDPRKTPQEKLHLWFGGTPEIDGMIRERYGEETEAAERGAYREWENDPRSCLALILLLDQFPLNIYRDEARSFRVIDQALPIALRAIERGFDRQLGFFERVFLYLPLEHAEDLAIQRRSVELYERLEEEAPPALEQPMALALDMAIKHLEVIERFGRYPDRNPILGRTHTAAEAEYMAAGGPPF